MRSVLNIIAFFIIGMVFSAFPFCLIFLMGILCGDATATAVWPIMGMMYGLAFYFKSKDTLEFA